MAKSTMLCRTEPPYPHYSTRQFGYEPAEQVAAPQHSTVAVFNVISICY